MTRIQNPPFVHLYSTRNRHLLDFRRDSNSVLDLSLARLIFRENFRTPRRRRENPPDTRPFFAHLDKKSSLRCRLRFGRRVQTSWTRLLFRKNSRRQRGKATRIQTHPSFSFAKLLSSLRFQTSLIQLLFKNNSHF